MPNTTLSKGIQAVQRLQQTLAAQILVTPENQKILLTFSAGIAQCQDSETQENLIKRADFAMYDAKHAGKNCVKAAV